MGFLMCFLFSFVFESPHCGYNGQTQESAPTVGVLKSLVVWPFYLPYVRRFLLRLRNMLFLFQPRLLALLIFLAVSFEIVVGHNGIRADG